MSARFGDDRNTRDYSRRFTAARALRAHRFIQRCLRSIGQTTGQREAAEQWREDFEQAQRALLDTNQHYPHRVSLYLETCSRLIKEITPHLKRVRTTAEKSETNINRQPRAFRLMPPRAVTHLANFFRRAFPSTELLPESVFDVHNSLLNLEASAPLESVDMRAAMEAVAGNAPNVGSLSLTSKLRDSSIAAYTVARRSVLRLLPRGGITEEGAEQPSEQQNGRLPDDG